MMEPRVISPSAIRSTLDEINCPQSPTTSPLSAKTFQAPDDGRHYKFWLKTVQSGFVAFFPAYFLLVPVWISVLYISWLTGHEIGGGFLDFLNFLISGMMLDVFCVLLISASLWKFYRLIRDEKPESPLKAFGAWMFFDLLRPERVRDFLHIFLIIYLLSTAFTFLKGMIPILVPFQWDEYFMELDKALFLGEHPWQVLQPWLGIPSVTFTLNLFYQSWFFMVFGFFLAMTALEKRHNLRLQYLLASTLVWVICGNILATVLSSAGPCFYDKIGLENSPYLPLMAYLNEANEVVPVWSLNVMDLLWQRYSDPVNPANMISAMPSLHVASSILFACFAFRIRTWFGLMMSFYAIMIFLGSIHLGWHYAVDGLFTLPLVLVLWLSSGVAVRKMSCKQPK